MLVEFFAQFAAGCFLAVAASAIHQNGWKYLRLMAAVCFGLSLIAMAALMGEPGWLEDSGLRLSAAGLAAGLAMACTWLFVNAAQQERVGTAQRWLPLVGGAACLGVAIHLANRADAVLATGALGSAAPSLAAVVISTVLGAALLGTTTAAMLLGHRYLTDTDMPIAPLRHLTRLFLCVVAARVAWAVVGTSPIWTGRLGIRGDASWFWLMISIRVGVGLVGTSIFAWMVWDCVKRRATQSATAMFYLTMIFVFAGELSAQYLLRTRGMAL